ncbi:MAG: alpha/beta hydrolase [Pseudomonadota bacterium]
MESVSYNVGDLNLAGLYWKSESGNKTPIIALHGWLDNAASFLSVAPLLKPHSVLALDQMGHGLSCHYQPGAAYHFIDGVTHIIVLLRQLGFEKVILLGHSMGGGISTLIAAAAPDLVEAVISVDVFGPLVSEPSNALEDLRMSVEQFVASQNKKSPFYDSVDSALALRNKIGNNQDETLRDIVERGLEKTPQGYVWRTDPRLRVHSAIRLTEKQVQTQLKGVQCPVLYIEADNGFKHAKQHYLKRKACLEKVEKFEVEGGHHVHIEKPQVCVDAIFSFLNKHGVN